MFGIKLSPNFNRPFAARSTADFWRRWHMSLSFWVRDYLYVPLTAGTRNWGQWGIYFSLLITFLALGLWHGAGLTFAIYGLIQGVLVRTLAYILSCTIAERCLVFLTEHLVRGTFFLERNEHRHTRS